MQLVFCLVPLSFHNEDTLFQPGDFFLYGCHLRAKFLLQVLKNLKPHITYGDNLAVCTGQLSVFLLYDPIFFSKQPLVRIAQLFYGRPIPECL